MTQIDINSLLQQMQQPEFYPHPVSEPIELIQTHISYVFLTGDYAYKVKKDVNLGFLDFSSLEKRQKFLNLEIRLNRAIAPDLYLEVLPITQQGNRFILGGNAEAVECTSKMRQFPQENLFDNLLAKNRLSIEQISELGTIVAEFHQRAATNDYISSFGTVSKIKAAFDENYAQSQKYVGYVQTQKQLEETKAFTDKFFADREELLQARIDNHKIRECHGDLHLKNICLWQDKIQLFDRIEFNEQFRFVDLMYDIAFVVMDLEARGRKDFANIFLNSYLERTGDWQGLPLLPLYLSRQAYVRAKVTSLLLDTPTISAAQQKEISTTAANYYRQAWQYTRQSKGKLILMSGLSGSGKSTVAKQIALQDNGILIRSDAVRKHLAGITLDETGSDRIYTAQMTQQTYDRLLELGVMLAREGFTVILDAKYDLHIHRQKAISAATAEQIPLQILHCTAPIEVLRERLNKRSGDISDATADLLNNQLANREDFTAAEMTYVTTIDTSQ